MIALKLGDPDPATLVTPELRAAMRRAVDAPGLGAGLSYGARQGDPAFRRLLADILGARQGVALAPEDLMLVAGCTQALDMLVRLFAVTGDVVLVEAPTYAEALNVFRDRGLDIVSVQTDADGLIPDALADRLHSLSLDGRRAAILYTVATFNNPSGRVLTESRRIEVVELAQRYGLHVIEDDVYRDIALDGRVPPSLYALGAGAVVTTIGSFSKTLAPGFRLGWMISRRDVIRRCVASGTSGMGGGASPLAAYLLGEYCRTGHWEQHIARLGGCYRRRRDAAVSLLHEHMPQGVSWSDPAGGFFLWLKMPEGVTAQSVEREALRRGVSICAGDAFFVENASRQERVRVAFSCATPDELSSGIELLGAAIRTVAAGDEPATHELHAHRRSA